MRGNKHWKLPIHCSKGAVDIVVVDSVAALTPKAELEGDMGDSHVGLQMIMSTSKINWFDFTNWLYGNLY